MEDYFEHIDDYVEGKLTSEDHKLFEAEMDRNSSLKEGVKNYHDAKKISEGLLELDMMDTLNKLQQEESVDQKEIKTKSNGKWIGLAAVLAFLILAGWWFSNNADAELDKSKIYANYIKPVNSDATKSIDTLGMNDFEKGKYYFSLNRFEESEQWLKLYMSIEDDKESLSECYYWLGAAHLEQWEVDEAKKAWEMSDEKQAKENINIITKFTKPN